MAKKTNEIEFPLILQNNEYGKQIYSELYESVAKDLGTAEKLIFTTYCVEYGNYIQYELQLKKEGVTVLAGNGTEIPHPLFNIKQTSYNAMMKAAMQLGVTPKSKIKSTTKAKISKIDLLRGGQKAQ